MNILVLLMIKTYLASIVESDIKFEYNSHESLKSSLSLTSFNKQNPANESFLNYSTLTPSIFTEIFKAAFSDTTGKYFTSVLSFTDSPANIPDYLAELGPREWHTSTATYKTAQSVIISVNSPEQFQNLIDDQSALWSQESRYVILVVNCSDKVKIEIAALWKTQQIYKSVVICGITNLNLYILKPYTPWEEGKILRVQNMSEITDNVLNGNTNLYGALIKIALFQTSPTAIAQNGSFIGGVDFRTFQVFRKFMNFSSVLFNPSDGKSFTHAGKNASGSVRDIVLGNVHIALNAHLITDYKIDKIKFTRFVYMDKICFVVAMPGFKSHYSVLLHIFTLAVWQSIVVVYVISVLMYFIIQKTLRPKCCRYTFVDVCLYMFGLKVFGATHLKAHTLSQKFLIGSLLMSVLIINNTFQGLLMTVLSKPRREPSLNTLEEVLESDLTLQSRSVETLVSDPELLPKLNTFRQRKLSGNNFIRLGRFSILNIQKYQNYLQYNSEINEIEHLHTVPECISLAYLGYVIPKNSPLLDRMNKILVRVQESGLIIKWYGREMDYVLRHEFWPVETDDEEKDGRKDAFSLIDLAFDFLFVVIGLSVSVFCFIFELGLGQRRKRSYC